MLNDKRGAAVSRSADIVIRRTQNESREREKPHKPAVIEAKFGGSVECFEQGPRSNTRCGSNDASSHSDNPEVGSDATFDRKHMVTLVVI